jgi:hypothetical protein
MPEPDAGYKCSSCGETFSKSTSAKKHVTMSKKCRSANGTFPKVISYKISTSRSDRRVGGREIIRDPSNNSDDDYVVSNEQLQNDSLPEAAREHDEISLAPAPGIFVQTLWRFYSHFMILQSPSKVTSLLQFCFAKYMLSKISWYLWHDAASN